MNTYDNPKKLIELRLEVLEDRRLYLEKLFDEVGEELIKVGQQLGRAQEELRKQKEGTGKDRL